MSDTEQNIGTIAGRDSLGRFVKGNKCGKKPWKKTLIQGKAWEELYSIAEIVTQATTNEVDKAIETKSIKELSLLANIIIKQTAEGNYRPVQHLMEMILGKPKIYMDTTTNPDKNTITLNYKLRSKDERPTRKVTNESEQDVERTNETE